MKETFSYTTSEQELLLKIKKFWEEILLHTKKLAEVTDASYETFLRYLKVDKFEEQKLVVLAPDDIAMRYVEKKYRNIIEKALQQCTGTKISVLISTNVWFNVRQ